MKKRISKKNIETKVAKEAKAKTTKKIKKEKPDIKAVSKDISRRGNKMFLDNRKTVSALKKLTRSIAKILTEANQTGNQKLITHLSKMFGLIGFNTDSAVNKVSWCYEAKVKPMKAPKVKPGKKSEEEKPERKRRPRKNKTDQKPTQEQQSAAVQPKDEPTPEELAKKLDAGVGPTDDELSKLDQEPTPEVLAGDSNDLANIEQTGAIDDNEEQEPEVGDEDPEHDGDDDDDDDEEEAEPQSYEEGLAAYRREAWGNGDFERDDI